MYPTNRSNSSNNTKKLEVLSDTSYHRMGEEIENIQGALVVGGRKRVRLYQHPRVLEYEDTMNDNERELTWWQQEDFEETKASAKRICREMRLERRFSNSLTDAYDRVCCGEEMASPKTNLQTLQKNSDFAGLFDDHGARGLERLSSRLHGMRRRRHLQEIKNAVFLEQARQAISKQNDPEALAQRATNASRRARAFASLLGQADAWAAERGENTSRESLPAVADSIGSLSDQSSTPDVSGESEAELAPE